MVYFDSNLGQQLPERSYAESCDLTMDTFKVRVKKEDDNKHHGSDRVNMTRIKWISLFLHMLLAGMARQSFYETIGYAGSCL